MLISLREYLGFRLLAQNGDELGRIAGFHFDDRDWAVRHLVIETGSKILGRRVLIAPLAIDRVDPEHKAIHTHLTAQQVQQSPQVDTDQPFSREAELSYYEHYQWPYYWTGAGVFGAATYPAMIPPPVPTSSSEALPGVQAGSADPHLQDCEDVTGYHIVAADERFGALEDFVVDCESWRIRYLRIGTRRWLPGKHVLLQPEYVTSVDWATREIRSELYREEIISSPAIQVGQELDRMTELKVRSYYARIRPMPGFRRAS